MKIFNTEQIRSADKFTIAHEKISSLNLMERAAEASLRWILANIKQSSRFSVLCGTGNNGGDGLAIARLLYHHGLDVDVFIDKSNLKFSDDARTNYQQLSEISGITLHDFSEFKNKISSDSIIIDAIFGTGLTRKISGPAAELISQANALPNRKISIDLPSGLSADGQTSFDTEVFKADDTLTFQFWKKSLLHPETARFAGKVHVLDIGLSEIYIDEEQSTDFIIDKTVVKNIYRPRKLYSHKGTYGKACIVGGSYGKMGAAVIAARAALETGAGVIFAAAPDCGYTILQSTCPEAMFIKAGEKFIEDLPLEKEYTLGIGPGLGKEKQTASALVNFLRKYEKSLVLDADALNILADDPKTLTNLPDFTIITPHPKEFGRLFGETQDSYARLELAKTKAKELQIIIVLKDHHSQIVTPDGIVYYNTSGNPGMAKGGSGDALTGIITALLAQKYTPVEAAVFGTWLHGKAGDFAAEQHSQESMTALQLVESIGKVFRFLND